MEETFKVTQYILPPGTATVTTKSHHQCQIQMSQAPSGTGTPPLPKEIYSNAWPPWQWKKYFLISNLNLPCYSQYVIDISSCPLTAGMAGETNPHLATPSFQELCRLMGSPLEPPLLDTKKPQVPQPCLFHKTCFLILSWALLPFTTVLDLHSLVLVVVGHWEGFCEKLLETSSMSGRTW